MNLVQLSGGVTVQLAPYFPSLHPSVQFPSIKEQICVDNGLSIHPSAHGKSQVSPYLSLSLHSRHLSGSLQDLHDEEQGRHLLSDR